MGRLLASVARVKGFEEKFLAPSCLPAALAAGEEADKMKSHSKHAIPEGGQICLAEPGSKRSRPPV